MRLFDVNNTSIDYILKGKGGVRVLWATHDSMAKTIAKV